MARKVIRLLWFGHAPTYQLLRYLSYADRGSCGIKEPLPTTPFMVGSGGGWIVKCLVVVDRL